MDCFSEESIVRMKLEEFKNIHALHFDIPQRQVAVIHEGNGGPITAAINSLHLNSSLITTKKINEDESLLFVNTEGNEKKILWQVLTINLFFFVLETITGFISDSMGLVADSLDMLADAFVYSLALFVVGKATFQKRKVSKISGYLQLSLAILGGTEVIRRFLGHSEPPDFKIMICISILALAGNAITLYLLQKPKTSEAHIKASVICTSTDVIVNAGVIIAGILVYLTASELPDLIIGMIVFILVGMASYRMLKL